jgi:RsiW-degrading membrane proteinase PrsW (M82 family)
MNWHIVLANVIVVAHLIYVAIVLVIIPLIFVGWWRRWKWVRNFWVRIIHFLMMGVVVVETGLGVPCPLTIWERDLRLAGGQFDYVRDSDGDIVVDENFLPTPIYTDGYEEDFVRRCVHQFLFYDPSSVPPWVLHVCYFIIGGVILLSLILVPPHWPWKAGGQTASAST